MKTRSIVTAGILDVVNPVRCCCCEELVSHLHNGICGYCLDRITSGSGYSSIINHGISDPFSMDNRKWFLDECIPLQEYSAEMKKVIQAIKFDNRVSLVPVMSSLVNSVLSGRKWEMDYIVPVPMKRARMIKRGFNQAELLAKGVSRRSGVPCNAFLAEKGYSKIQKSLQINERFINVLGRFSIKGKNVDVGGKSILLIDDVYTTGATLNECARILKNEGASVVRAVTLACTPLKKD